MRALGLSLQSLGMSLRATTRNPVLAYPWIPDVETPDLIRGRDDKLLVRDDNFRGRDDRTKGRGSAPAEPSTAAPSASLSLAKTVSRISELNGQRRQAL